MEGDSLFSAPETDCDAAVVMDHNDVLVVKRLTSMQRCVCVCEALWENWIIF